MRYRAEQGAGPYRRAKTLLEGLIKSACGSGLVSRKGCAAAPGFQRRCTNCWGRFAALSRHKAAPTRRAM
ncbi:hypothetical protein E6B08_29510 [Pseudomonas putida]|uniref:Uncharacterized protein n=1 Tax=Pseudomonas putida TaxID=303 RepID=A0A4D6XIN3_PSEPU|nr:hypothetical protein E6B08_29510 [Pseudomonas putida]